MGSGRRAVQFGPVARRLISFVVLVICLPTCAQQHSADVSWRTVLNWLPPDTQTLLVAPRPFVLVEQTDSDPEGDFDPVTVLRTWTLGGIVGFSSLYSNFVGKRVLLSVAGVRRFREFSGLGMGPYDGCAFFTLQRPLDKTLVEMLPDAVEQEVLGVSVFQLSQVREGSRRDRPEEESLFIAELTPTMYATASDPGSMRILLARRAEPPTLRALPRDLPEWKHVDTQAPFWAIRHYPPVNDWSKLGVIDESDPQAIGVAYSAGTKQVQTVIYLSRNPRVVDLIRNNWRSDEEEWHPATVRRLSQNAVQIKVRTPEGDARGLFTILLLNALGFPIAM